MPLTLLRHATQKPPPGPLKLDIGHPLSQQLAFATILNDYGNGTPGELLTRVAGSLTGSWASTPYGSAASLTAATDGINFGNNPAWAPGTNPFTIVAFANPTASSQSSGLWSRRANGGGTAIILGANLASNGGGLNGVLGTYNASPVLAAQSTSTTVINGGYHQFAVTRTGVTVALYSDAVSLAVTLGNAGNVNYTATDSVFVGTFGNGNAALSGYQLNGQAVYAYYWNRALSAAEIASLYAEPYAMFQTRPLQRWFVLAAGTHSATDTATVTEGPVKVGLSAVDAATLSEALANALSTVDAATVTDTASIAVVAQDSMAFAEAVALAIVSSDSATLTDLAAIALTASDAITLGESQTVAIPVTGTDAITLSESASVAVAATGADMLTLAELVTIVSATAATDTASIAEAAVNALGAVETAALFEAAAIAVGTTDAAIVAEVQAIATAAQDAAALAEAQANALAAAEAGTVSESAVVVPSGGGPAPGTEAAAVAEAAAIIAAAAAVDTASMVDQLTIALKATDAGTLAEQIALAVVLNDQAVLLEAVSILANHAVAAAEAIALADSAAVSVQTTAATVGRHIVSDYALNTHAVSDYVLATHTISDLMAVG